MKCCVHKNIETYRRYYDSTMEFLKLLFHDFQIK